MTETLRDYQEWAFNDAIQFLRSAPPGAKRPYVAPCGSGKSYIEVALLNALESSALIAPRQEIIDGLIDKGANPEQLWTPVKFRNRLLEGYPAPQRLIIDEAHHDTCNTAAQIRLCVGDIPTVAFTATPFRGTPQGTQAFRALYGEPVYILTLRDAIDRGICTLPNCTTIPILDDDRVEISNGEFRTTRVDAATDWTHSASLVRDLWEAQRPTVVSLPSIRACAILNECLGELDINSSVVTTNTSRADRRIAFDECIKGRSVLLQVNVVSEGVDLPFRNLIDLAPTMSPVKWLQQFGRIMRPGGESHYICTNRNLMRHGYLLEGCLPSTAFANAQLAFPTPSRRSGVRAFGLEGVGRLKPAPVPLANGLSGSAYYVTRTEGHVATQYVAIVLPQSPEVLWARRENDHSSDNPYGRWVRCDPPSELRGFASVPPRPLTTTMLDWWRHPYRGAKSRGLDPDAKVDSKVFQVLPVLCNLGVKVA